MVDGVLTDMYDSMKVQVEVARLDGLLAGSAAASGRLGDYSAFAYVIELGDECGSIEKGIKAHYSWLPEMEFSQIVRLERGLRDLETGIRPFLVRGRDGADSGALVGLQKLMSFRVMEIVSVATDEALDLPVYKLISVGAALESSCVFFCLRLEGIGIVMQFNDDAEFRGAALAR